MDINPPLLKSLLIMADIIEARDPYTGGHVWRVSQFAKLLALKAGLSHAEIIQASLAGYLHDLGKVGIPDQVLLKPGKLTEQEFKIIQTHPSIGAKLLQSHPLCELVYEAVAHHHERLDGKGYPQGLPAKALSPLTRIVTLADAFDAMTSTRPYRAGMPVPKALAHLLEEAGTQFDPQLVRHMVELGHAGDLKHIIGHSAEGIPLVNCPHCGPVLAIPRATQAGDILYCRACGAELRLSRRDNAWEAHRIGKTNDPDKLKPTANEEAVEDLLSVNWVKTPAFRQAVFNPTLAMD